jgi:hypothetical protein
MGAAWNVLAVFPPPESWSAKMIRFRLDPELSARAHDLLATHGVAVHYGRRGGDADELLVPRRQERLARRLLAAL